MLINVLYQTQPLHQQVHRADAATVHRRGSLRHFIAEVARFEHGAGLLFPVLGLESALNSLLAIAKHFAIGSIHSKWPFVGCCGFVTPAFQPIFMGISSFLFQLRAKITLVQGLEVSWEARLIRMPRF